MLNEDLTAVERELLDAQVPQYSKFQLAQIGARRAAQDFMDNCPAFYPSEINLEIVCDWLVKNGLPPETNNFTLAFTALSTAHLLEDAPDVPAPKPGSLETLTLADVERMPSDAYRRRLQQEPGFAEKVETLLTAASRPRIQAGAHAGTGYADRVSR